MNSIEMGQQNQAVNQQQQQQQVHIQQQQQVVTPTMEETAQNGSENGTGKPTGCKELRNFLNQLAKYKI